MATQPPSFVDPTLTGPIDPVRADARIVDGVAHNGKPCRIVDNTCSIDPAELRAVLANLIAARKFGIGGVSAHGGTAMHLHRPLSTHIQFGERLYRILLYAYEARIETF